MNILFLTISSFTDVTVRGIYPDLLRKFVEEGHKVYVVSPRERRYGIATGIVTQGETTLLGVKTLNIQKTNVIEKGIGTVSLEYQFKSAIKKYLGDISFDFSKTIGSGGAASLSASLTIPTGQYDIKRGIDASKEILPSSFQKGGGLYSLTLGWDYIRDTDKGIWLYSLSYTHPFAMRLFSGENEFNDSYWKNIKNKDGDRFKYRFKPYGENDLGAFTPPSIGGSIAYGYRGRAGIVQSFGLNFSVPLGVAWIASEQANDGVYDPRPDPDHQAWSISLVYGIEFSNPDFPVFLAFSLPIHDKAGGADPDNEYSEKPMKEWNAPDWSDIGQQWTIAVGVKGSFF